MMPLIEMLTKMQNGEAVAELSRQFQLSQEQTQAAIAALMPAFGQGFRHNAHDPFGAGQLLAAIASGQHSRFFESPMDAFTPAGTMQGNDILGQLFGSKDLSRAVAQQAAQATGIAQETFKQMLPALASIIMGGLHKQSTGQFGGVQQGQGTNPLADFMQQMMKQGGMGNFSGQAVPGEKDPFDNPFAKAFQQMMGSSPAKESQPKTDAFANNPFAAFFEEMMKTSGGATAQSEPEKPANPSGRPRNPYDDIFGKMFESGREVRDEYQKGMEKIFDHYFQGMHKPQ
jgi:hypothetical protein